MKKAIVRSLVTSVLLACVAGVAGAPGAVEAASSAVRVKEIFFGTSQETVCEPGHLRFELDELRDLYVCVVWRGLAGAYVAEFTFVSPDGNVYQTLTLAFTTPDARATARDVEFAGRRHRVTPAGWGRKGETVTVVVLPVGGTFITQHSLAGLWTVRVSLNGQPVDREYFDLDLR